MSNEKTISVESYKEVIQQAFTKHYTEGSDVWSGDQSLVEATTIAYAAAVQSFVREDLHLLDVGCGNGRHCLSLPPSVASYYGVDLFAHENWNDLANIIPFATQFAQGDFVAWAAQQTKRFDLILDNGCFHHQHPDEHVAYLQEIHNLLDTNGLFSVVVWGEVFKEGNIDDYGRYHLYFSPESISELIRSVSFDVLQVIESKALIGKTQLQVIARKK